MGYGRDTDPKCAEVKLTPISKEKANRLPGGVCWALECGGGYRDESGNSYWRIHAAMKFLESKKINRDEFDHHCKWHQCSAEELQDFYEGHEGEPIYLWKWREVRVCPGRPKYIRARAARSQGRWANFKLEEVVEEGVYVNDD